MKSQVRINREITDKIKSAKAGKERFDLCERIFSERKVYALPSVLPIPKARGRGVSLVTQPYKDIVYYVVRKGRKIPKSKGGRIRFYLRRKASDNLLTLEKLKAIVEDDDSYFE